MIACTIGSPEATHAAAELVRVVCVVREARERDRGRREGGEENVDWAQVFGLLNRFPNRRLRLDHTKPEARI